MPEEEFAEKEFEKQLDEEGHGAQSLQNTMHRSFFERISLVAKMNDNEDADKQSAETKQEVVRKQMEAVSVRMRELKKTTEPMHTEMIFIQRQSQLMIPRAVAISIALREYRNKLMDDVQEAKEQLSLATEIAKSFANNNVAFDNI